MLLSSHSLTGHTYNDNLLFIQHRAKVSEKTMTLGLRGFLKLCLLAVWTLGKHLPWDWTRTQYWDYEKYCPMVNAIDSLSQPAFPGRLKPEPLFFTVCLPTLSGVFPHLLLKSPPCSINLHTKGPDSCSSQQLWFSSLPVSSYFTEAAF